MSSTLLIMTWMASMTFMFLNHPLSFGLVLLIQTFNISMITGLLNYNFWFSYILFLVMVGGMLILFIYMTSIASNEKFKFSYKILMFLMMTTMLSLMSMMIDNFFFNLFTNEDLTNFYMNSNNNFSMNKYINWPSNLIFLTIIIYLLITLIAIVKITNITYGPLRQKF